MSLRTDIDDLALAMGTDVKTLTTWLFGSPSGTLALLETTDKTSFTGAINSILDQIASGTAPDASQTTKGIVELATSAEATAGTSDVLAVTPVGLKAVRDALKAEILGGAGPAFDTLNELKALIDLADESADIADLITLVGQKANSADVYTKTEIGDLATADFVGTYNAAKA